VIYALVVLLTLLIGVTALVAPALYVGSRHGWAHGLVTAGITLALAIVLGILTLVFLSLLWKAGAVPEPLPLAYRL
jgi:hypothetical protein